MRGSSWVSNIRSPKFRAQRYQAVSKLKTIIARGTMNPGMYWCLLIYQCWEFFATKLIDRDDKHFNTVPIKHLLQQLSENNFIQVCEALHFALANLCCTEKNEKKWLRFMLAENPPIRPTLLIDLVHYSPSSELKIEASASGETYQDILVLVFFWVWCGEKQFHLYSMLCNNGEVHHPESWEALFTCANLQSRLKFILKLFF